MRVIPGIYEQCRRLRNKLLNMGFDVAVLKSGLGGYIISEKGVAEFKIGMSLTLFRLERVYSINGKRNRKTDGVRFFKGYERVTLADAEWAMSGKAKWHEVMRHEDRKYTLYKGHERDYGLKTRKDGNNKNTECGDDPDRGVLIGEGQEQGCGDNGGTKGDRAEADGVGECGEREK